MAYELCLFCSNRTGRAGLGEDSRNFGGVGPFCEECYTTIREVASAPSDPARESRIKAVVEARKQVRDWRAARDLARRVNLPQDVSKELAEAEAALAEALDALAAGEEGGR